MNLEKTIKTAKELINLPYNKFNLDNYQEVLDSKFSVAWGFTRNQDKPCDLMSGNHMGSGIIKTQGLGKVYIIGKGILFDSGGLDLKKEMLDMTNDKAGMITAIAIADYFQKFRSVVALCPVTTNFIQSSLITPGDELKIGKKIVKVTDTDAEGRLILAEALVELGKYITPNDIIITIATLTGCVEYAVGKEATGFFSTNQVLAMKYRIASKLEKEDAWQLPLWEKDEKKYYKGNKIKNYTKEIKCGASEAALFLKQFIPNQNWLHLDIASSAFGKDGKANGTPIKSLVRLIEKLS
jgi:leucyl aminopeptidase